MTQRHVGAPGIGTSECCFDRRAAGRAFGRTPFGAGLGVRRFFQALASERRGQGEFRLLQPFTYEIGRLGSGERVTVPAGYPTDLCSVPWFARAFIPIAGRAAKPALLHDWLIDHDDPRAAAVFDEALGVAGVPGLRRGLMVAAVRLWARIRPLRRLF